jgi:hypothetical protein
MITFTFIILYPFKCYDLLDLGSHRFISSGMLSRTDWRILPTFPRTFASLSQCQAVDIGPKKERNFTEDLNFQKRRFVNAKSRVSRHLLIV